MKWTLRCRLGAGGPAAVAAAFALALPVSAAGLAPGAMGAAAGAAGPAPGAVGTSAEGTSTAVAAELTVASGSWGSAAPVPGLARLNVGGSAGVNSVSCASAGNCVVGGDYQNAQRKAQAFVASELDGTWGSAIEVPGTAGLNTGGNAEVASVSCASAGNCLAGGFYSDRGFNPHAFVASERGGTWGTAVDVPGTVAPGSKGNSAVTSVSCASAGNCAIGGINAPGTSFGQAFVASERNGKLGTASKVTGTGAGTAAVNSVSCGSAGNCVAAGFYVDSQNKSHAFVTDEQNGTWGAALDVLASSGLNAGGNASVNSVSCASAGNCAAGGFYKDSKGHFQVFVVSERSGHWQHAIEVPGSAQLNAGGLPQVSSVSCAGAGNCAAGGAYLDSSGNRHAFVVSERSGQWQTAIAVPGTTARSWVNAVSCGSAGNCAAAGGYTDSSGNDQGFVASEQNNVWGTAIEAPSPGLNAGGRAEVASVSCVTSADCVAGGEYESASLRTEGFVISRQ